MSQPVTKKYKKTKTKKRVSTKNTSRAAMMLGRPRGAGLPVSQVELKLLDTEISHSPLIGTTGTNDQITCLNALSQGSGSYMRVGRKVNLKSIRVKGDVTLRCGMQETSVGSGLFVGANGGAVVRIAVVLDRSPNLRALPTFDEIFAHQVFDGTISSYWRDNLNPQNLERFRVLKDDCVPMVPRTVPVTTSAGVPLAAALSSWVASFDHFISLAGLQTTYGATEDPPTVDEITTNSILFIVRVGEATSIASSRLDAICRLRYTDA